MSIHIKRKVSPHKHLKDDIIDAREVRPDRPPYKGVHATDVVVDSTLVLDETLPACPGSQGTSFPSSPVDGQLFYRTDLHALFRYDATLGEWISLDLTTGHGTSFPSNPREGDLFYRSDEDTLYRYNGSAWEVVGRKGMITGEGASFPGSPEAGDLFYRTDHNVLYRYDGSSWKSVHQLSGSGTTFPSSPRVGDFFYRTDLGCLFRYDGSNWVKVMHLASGSSWPSSPEEGDYFYHSGYEQTFYYNGTSWIPLATISRSGTSFPSDKVAGDVFYRTDLKQFYRYNGTDWIFIGTPSLDASQAENLVQNAAFEMKSADGKAEYWTLGGTNPPDFSTYYSDRGGRSLYVNCASGQTSNAYSNYIDIKGSHKYFAACMVRSAGGEQCTMSVLWYDKNKSFISQNNISLGTDGVWVRKSNTFTSQSTARYARIAFYFFQPTSASAAYIDDAVLSEQRSLVPTAEIVAAGASAPFDGFVAVPASTWTTIRSLAVPDANHEVLFIQVNVLRNEVGGSMDGLVRINCDSINYPMDIGLQLMAPSVVNNLPKDHTIITIPKNVKGETLNLQFYTSVADDYKGSIRCWGHSEHKHQ